MSSQSQNSMLNNMLQNGFDPYKQISAPTWNSWTDNTKNSFQYDPGNYISSPSYKWASWIDSPTRFAYSGSTPTFQRLSNGDYDAYQSSLRTPGEIVAKNSFDSGKSYLNETMTNNGMYGSSMMANQANDKLNKNYMDTMATNANNAASQRYSAEQKDNYAQSDFDKSIWQTKVNENQSLNQMNLQDNLAKNQAIFSQYQNYNNYNAQNAQNQNSYNLNRANWGINATNQYNQYLQSPYEDQWRRASWNANQNDNTYNRFNSFWANADPLKDEYQVNQTATLAKQREGSSGGGVGGLIGSIGGSLIGGMFGGVGAGVGKAVGGAIGDKFGSWLK